MKNIKVLIIAIVTLSLSSCSDFMEFPPVASFNIDSVFSKYSNAERLLSDMYNYPIPLNFDTRGFGSSGTRMGGGTFASALTDEGQSFDVQQGYQVQRYYTGNVEASTAASWSSAFKGEDDYAIKWRTIRRAYIILNNIDRVPDATFPSNQNIAAKDQKERIKAEAKLMVALVYFEMWKRYGGVPILTREFRAEDDFAEFKKERATFKETHEFIIGLLDDVITNYANVLPAKLTESSEYGRFPMALAYGLKARVELYAASPLFNTNNPYSKELGENSDLICFMNYDKERWRKAADAATAAINFCTTNGYVIVDDPANRKNGMNYTTANIHYPNRGNTESIWGVLQSSGGLNWQYFTIIRGLPNPYGYAPNLVPLNQIERYEKDTAVSGFFKSWENPISLDIPAIASGTSANDGGKLVAAVARKPYEGLDPRFYASIAYNGVPDYGSQPFVDMADAWVDTNKGGAIFANLHGVFSYGKQRTTVLHYVRKFTRGYEFRESTMNPINIYMRLAELYLIRAEALNEYGGGQAQVESDLNLIRNRSGMPNVLGGQSQPEMRKTIAHERNIELFYEDQRWFDLRRTLMSETSIPVNIYKVDIKKWYKRTNSPWPYKITYEKTFYSKRVWYNHWYMNPFPTQEVNKGYGLLQNPGW